MKVDIFYNKPNKNGLKFSEKDLKNLAGKHYIPVNIEFNDKKIVGYTKSIEYKDNKLIADIELHDDICLKDKIFRPGFILAEKQKNFFVGISKIYAIAIINKIEDIFNLGEK